MKISMTGQEKGYHLIQVTS